MIVGAFWKPSGARWEIKTDLLHNVGSERAAKISSRKAARTSKIFGCVFDAKIISPTSRKQSWRYAGVRYLLRFARFRRFAERHPKREPEYFGKTTRIKPSGNPGSTLEHSLWFARGRTIRSCGKGARGRVRGCFGRGLRR